ncbi:MAG TPA: hypothetical protein VN753_04295 [Terracidiphilus sp.]|jgi:hypothetical protein|nr:hypothetical protein [Terracidiphilus sp.]
MAKYLSGPLVLICGSALVLSTYAAMGQSGKTLTNDDVVEMVKKKLPESVIVTAIKSTPGNYDTSASELIRLNGAGVTESELNAMLAIGHKDGESRPQGATADSSPGAISAKSRMPSVLVTEGKNSLELKLEKTQLAQTKNKPTSMGSLAADSAMTHAMQAGINTASWDAAVHMNSGVGGTGVLEGGSIVSGMLSHRTPTVTYVWGVPGAASGNLVHSSSPIFDVDFSRTPGVDTEDYEPAIVKLTPAQNSCRIVGATQAKADASASAAADWQVYSHYLEERVTAGPEKLSAGRFKIRASQLLPGEYGVVLRPVSKTKKFSGGDVARAQGDGLMFDAIWTFRVADDAQ